MSPQTHQAGDIFAARDAFASAPGSDLNGKNIALLIFVAIVPVIIVAAAVSWLLCCYSRGRGCGRRKKEEKTTNMTQEGPPAPAADDTARQNVAWAPNRPAQALTRNDSMLSNGSSSQKLNEKGPTLPQGFV